LALPPIAVAVAAHAPTIATLPPAGPAPMPIDELLPVLDSAGLILVQTEDAKLAEVHARTAAEPELPRVPRERSVLPPLDDGPLIQVETRSEALHPPG
jgi:ribonuclease E